MLQLSRRLVCLMLVATALGCATRTVSPRTAEPGTPHGEAVAPGAPASSDPEPANVEFPAPASADERAIRDLAHAAESCPFDPTRGFTGECDAVERWETEIELFANGRNDGALVTLLEHGSDRERVLAAGKLAAEGAAFLDNAHLAERIVAVAERERSEAVGADLGHAIASIDLRATGLEPRLLALLEKRSNRAVAVSLLEELAVHDAPTPAIEGAIAAAIGDPRGDVRQAAVLGLSTSPEGIACPAWARALGDSEIAVGLAAAHLVATTGQCPALVDPALSFVGAGQRKGLFRESVVASTLAELCVGRSVSRAQRGLAASLAEGFAAPELPTGLREEALRAALACDPDERKFVKRFLSDSDEWVRRMAKDLLKQSSAKSHGRKRRTHTE